MAGSPPRAEVRSPPLLDELLPLAGLRVLVRSDLNVPLRSDDHGGWEVDDDFRFGAALELLEFGDLPRFAALRAGMTEHL